MKGLIFSTNIQHAITFASLAHGEQERKQGGIPYITHPLAVAMILSTVTDDPDIVMAGILHDVLEDTPYLPESIEDSFGIRVLRFVEAVTDEDDPKVPWIKKKRDSVKRIIGAGHEAMLIKSADVIHNITDTLIYLDKTLPSPMYKPSRYRKNGDDRLERYRELVTDFANAWEQNPLLPQLQEAFKQLANIWR